MKKLQFIGLILLLTITTFSFIRCDNNETKLTKIRNDTRSFDYYIQNLEYLKSKTATYVNNEKSNFKSNKDVENFVLKTIKEDNQSLDYLNTSVYQKINTLKNKTNVNDISLNDTELSVKTINYFNELERLNN